MWEWESIISLPCVFRLRFRAPKLQKYQATIHNEQVAAFQCRPILPYYGCASRAGQWTNLKTETETGRLRLSHFTSTECYFKTDLILIYGRFNILFEWRQDAGKIHKKRSDDFLLRVLKAEVTIGLTELRPYFERAKV